MTRVLRMDEKVAGAKIHMSQDECWDRHVLLIVLEKGIEAF